MNQDSTVALRSGNRMPVLGLGTWMLTHETADTVAEALGLGYHMIDTSGDYGTQPGVGEGIRRNGFQRSDIYVVTKVEETDDAYAATVRDLEELGLEYADLMLIHRPPENGAGEALWRGLIRARADGLARDIGVSNYSADQISSLIESTGETPSVNQIEWSPFGHSDEMLRYAREHRMVIQAYSPLTHAERLDDPTLVETAEKYGKTPAQILVRWNLQRGTVPLPKANQRRHLAEDIDVFDFDIAPDDMIALNGLNGRFSALGELPYA